MRTPHDPRLAGVLTREYVGFRHEGGPARRWVEPPRPALTLIVTLEGQLRAGGRALPRTWIGGLSADHDVVEIEGDYECLDLKLAPLGAYTLLAVPLSELGGGVHPLDDVLGPDGRRLEERLAEASGWPERFATLERFLLARAGAGPVAEPAVAWAWSRLCASSGRLAVEALAAEIGCSRRYLSTKFRQQIGQPPKTVARLLRFEHACRLIGGEPTRLADIAHDCGYYDQSHLNRDFRDLAGTTPGDFVARAMRSHLSKTGAAPAL